MVEILNLSHTEEDRREKVVALFTSEVDMNDAYVGIIGLTYSGLDFVSLTPLLCGSPCSVGFLDNSYFFKYKAASPCDGGVDRCRRGRPACSWWAFLDDNIVSYILAG